VLAPTVAAAIGFRAVSELEGADAGGQHHVSVSSLGTIEQLPRPLASTLAPGLESEFEFDVVGPLLTDVGGTIAVRVLSTPGMVAVIERTCAVLSLQHLEQSKATVGFEICVKHVAASLEGARCRVHVRLREVAEGRKLRFDVEVRELADDERVIGVGTHERRVIDVGAHATVAGR
jgi:predicted thioesterase